MFLACQDCHRQYDVGDLQVGSKIHCHCGIQLEVPEIRARDAEVLHCASCGGHLMKGADSCEFCGSVVSSYNHNLGPACPECYARMVKGARFCSACGITIRCEKVQAGDKEHECPRCDGKVVERVAPNGSFSECTRCGGIWLEQGSFEVLVEDRDEKAVTAFMSVTARPDRKRSEREEEINTVKYIPCPVCKQLMNRKNFAGCSGIIIDWCRAHGYWFDVYELEGILKFVSDGGMDKARDVVQVHLRAHSLARHSWILLETPADHRFGRGFVVLYNSMRARRRAAA